MRATCRLTPNPVHFHRESPKRPRAAQLHFTTVHSRLARHPHYRTPRSGGGWSAMTTPRTGRQRLDKTLKVSRPIKNLTRQTQNPTHVDQLQNRATPPRAERSPATGDGVPGVLKSLTSALACPPVMLVEARGLRRLQSTRRVESCRLGGSHPETHQVWRRVANCQ